MRFALTLLAFVVCTGSAATAQTITLYRTLADHQAGKGTAIGEYEGYEWSKDGVILLTPPVKGKKPVAHEVKNYWGYSIGDHVYRLYGGKPHVILKQGKAVYYENGLAHMDMVLNVKDRTDVVYGKYCFVSATIESPIIYVPGKDADKAFAGNASLQPFLTCIRKFKWSDATKIRGCLGELD